MPAFEYAATGEAKVARKLIKEILSRGYTVSISDGEEWTVKRSTKQTEIFEALCSTGEDLVRARSEEGEVIGTFYLVWGNAGNGEELINDYSDNEICNAIVNAVEGN